jgi:hypothetical protein
MRLYTSEPHSASGKPGTLSTEHRRMLFEESGIAPEIVAERGYRTVRSRAELAGGAFKEYQRRAPALYVPVYSPDGTKIGAQLRPDKPRRDRRGKSIKYETPGGSKVMLDVHPRMREEVRHGDGDLFVTEGIKKSDALTSRGLPTVGITGVWNWQREGELLPCWEHVGLEGRRVYVVFDSDVMAKENVQLACERLVAALEECEADVRVVYLPDGEEGEKVGVDDYLIAGGTIPELKALAREFEPQDLGRIRLSRDEKLRAAVEDLERRFWAEEWKGQGGHSDRDVALKLIETARRHGKVVGDGIRIVKSWGGLELETKVSRRTLAKALNRLEERGFCYRDNKGRKVDKAGAFVLRASVNQYGGRIDGTEGKVTQELRTSDPGGLHLRAPRLRWSSPAYKPRRGLVRGTRKVREGPLPSARPAVKRLGKIRGAILDALDAAGGTATLREIADILHRKRPRDIRRRNLPMLEGARILTVEDDVVTLADNWLDTLDAARELGGEIVAEETARRNLKRKRKAYYGRHQVRPDHHYVNADADGWVEDLKVASRAAEEALPSRDEPPVSPLAAALADYLEKNAHDAAQRAAWLGLTLWALDLVEGKPSVAQVLAALEDLGGDAYRRELLERSRVAG